LTRARFHSGLFVSISLILLSFNSLANVSGFNDESELEAFFSNTDKALTTLCGLVFNADSFYPNGQRLRENASIAYKIRLRAEGYNGTYITGAEPADAWQTSQMFARQLKPQPQGDKYGGSAASGEDNFTFFSRSPPIRLSKNHKGCVSQLMANGGYKSWRLNTLKSRQGGSCGRSVQHS
jgi:hypothetical protein